MAIEIEVEKLITRESPRQILMEDFRSIPELPIRGGWGYDKRTAVIIDSKDPIVDTTHPFDGIGVEYAFIEKRLFEELIIFRPPDQRYSGIQKELMEQRIAGGEDGAVYDVLVFRISAFPDADWEALKAEWEGPDGIRSETFDLEAHQRRREALKVTYVSEYWFEISSYSGLK